MQNFKLLLTILVITIAFSAASAQDNFEEENSPRNQRRPNLLRELDLSQNQLREIRKINQANRQDLRAAQDKVAAARQNLDQAIYSERADETTVNQKLREFQEAQAEVARIRAFTEFSIRRLLTAEQLIRFRELRQQFGQIRRDRQQSEPRRQQRNQRRLRRENNQRTMPSPID